MRNPLSLLSAYGSNVAQSAREKPDSGSAVRYGAICPPSFKRFVENITAGSAVMSFAFRKSLTPESEKSSSINSAHARNGRALICHVIVAV